jgi:hypothetical protein
MSEPTAEMIANHQTAVQKLADWRANQQELQKLRDRVEELTGELEARIAKLEAEALELIGLNVEMRAQIAGWVSVETDGDPEEPGTYLCLFDDGIMETFSFSHLDYSRWGVSGGAGHPPCLVTHWMPLPDPPAAQEQSDDPQ